MFSSRPKVTSDAAVRTDTGKKLFDARGGPATGNAHLFVCTEVNEKRRELASTSLQVMDDGTTYVE